MSYLDGMMDGLKFALSYILGDDAEYEFIRSIPIEGVDDEVLVDKFIEVVDKYINPNQGGGR